MQTKKLLCAAAVATVALGACGMISCASEPAVQPECEHSMTRIAHSDPTCTSEGNIAHYACSLCNKTFFDEAGKIELTAQNAAIAKNKHSLDHYAAVEKVPEYWYCIACGKYFTDASATVETQYKTLYADSYDAIKLADVKGPSGNLFDGSAEYSPLYDDFTFRCFISWKNAEGKTLDDLEPADRLQVNINFNRVGAGSRVDWYNFGIGYGKSAGLFYKPVESGSIITASQQLTQLFEEQGGIYVVAVREGGTVSAYFEDADGNRRLFTGGSRFGAQEALERFAANEASGLNGWTLSVTETAICLGVADEKCIFDKAYA